MDQRNLELLLRSHFPILIIETQEELRALNLIKRTASKHGGTVLMWSAAKGLTTAAGNALPQRELTLGGFGASDERDATDEGAHQSPVAVLEYLNKRVKDSTVVMLDFHPYLTDPRLLRLVKEFALASHVNRSAVVFISHQFTPPAEIQRLCAHFEMTLPDAEKIRQMVQDEAKVWQLKNGNKQLQIDEPALDLLVQNLVGLSQTDASRLIRNAIYDDGAITHSDLPAVQATKYRLIDPDGILSFEYDTVKLDDVGGLDALKRWLALRKTPFLQEDGTVGHDIPKGILLLGVQGGGKSLAARAVAGAWGLPLLRLDFGALFNKYIGETERNLRETLQAAELLAPCVLWVDEIEKGLDPGDGEGGTSRRVLGTLLSWMAERKARVFLVATANDVSALPPELIRKGRLDEIFFVDLPGTAARRRILEIHLEKRAHAAQAFDLETLAVSSQGYSGAEIEQVVVSARYGALAERKPLNDSHLQEALASTRPLSVVMAEPVARLRQWAADRTIPAH